MPKPRIFVSSTYYDLKHVRSSLELFIQSVGYEPVLSEKGDIAYVSDMPLDESCYREASSADIFVLIIGGRYGSAASHEVRLDNRKFFDRYESITRKEYDSACQADVPVFILIESAVHSEYQTFLKNADNDTIKYAHVDSINIFRLISEIFAKPRNNPVFPFERATEIETWLRDQWAGLFRELLKARSQQRQLSALSAQISELKVVNQTLKNYLEVVVRSTNVENSSKIIEDEQRRIDQAIQEDRVKENDWVGALARTSGFSTKVLADQIRASKSFKDYSERLAKAAKAADIDLREFVEWARYLDLAHDDIDEARASLGLPPFPPSPERGSFEDLPSAKTPPVPAAVPAADIQERVEQSEDKSEK